MMPTSLDPFQWFSSVARAERLDEIEQVWPRFALARRELLTAIEIDGLTAKLGRMTRAVDRSPLLKSPQAMIYRTALLDVLADAWEIGRSHASRISQDRLGTTPSPARRSAHSGSYERRQVVRVYRKSPTELTVLPILMSVPVSRARC
jgi:hypothetical protein